MARYSVATTRNNLSSLIDKALAGEEVVITRHGKPTAKLSMVRGDSDESKSEVSDADMERRREWMDRLQTLRDSMPRPKLSYLQIKKLEQADYEH
jgi:antitoxin (DNA-binding transcriptional repressor) of toxin-antitoxin stability system